MSLNVDLIFPLDNLSTTDSIEIMKKANIAPDQYAMDCAMIAAEPHFLSTTMGGELLVTESIPNAPRHITAAVYRMRMLDGLVQERWEDEF